MENEFQEYEYTLEVNKELKRELGSMKEEK